MLVFAQSFVTYPEPDYHSSDEEAEDKRGTKRRQSRPKAKTSAPKKRSKKSEEPGMIA